MAIAPPIAHMIGSPKSRPEDYTQQTPQRPPKRDHHLFHLQRDLDSPSAALRLRALRALKSPNKHYNNFDIPHDEISIITTEERNPCPPPTLSEILQDVIVYVEVRTGSDNRSEGVKTIIAKLGAKVNDRLLRNTTHVVFKDGLLSTYKRAKSWNVPIVSILWIEACKVQKRLCETSQFPISNIHLYEYPEIYGKIARVRCMQPDSELMRRPRKRHGTPTGTKDKEVAKKVSALDEPTTTPKNDIQRFFKPLSQNKQLTESESTESPATRLLNRMTNGCFTPLTTQIQPDVHKDKTNETDLTDKRPVAKKTLSFGQEKRVDKPRSSSMTVVPPQDIIPLRVSRRSTSMHESTRHEPKEDQVQTEPRLTRRRSSLNMSKISSLDENSSQSTAQPLPQPEPRLTRRRSLQLTAQSKIENSPDPPVQQDSQISRRRSFTTISTTKPSTPTVIKKPSFQAIDEEPLLETTSKNMSLGMGTTTAQARTSVNNRTNYVQQSMEVSMSRAVLIGEATGRRTLYTTNPMEISAVNVENGENINPYLEYSTQANVTTQTSLDNIGEQTPVPVFSSTRLPGSAGSTSNRRRSLFHIDIDLINERINTINSTSQRRSLALANAAELGESRALAPLQAVVPEEKSTEPKMRRLFTPNEDIVLSSSSSSSKRSRQSISGNTASTGTVKRRRSLAAQKPTAAVGPILQTNFQSNDENETDTDLYVTPNASVDIIASASESHGDCVMRATKRRTIHTLVHTNMHREQVQVIQKAIRKLRGVRLDPTVTKRTTHLVSLEPRRTLNLLRGLIRGVWIVSYEWILESMQAGKWLDEQRYELTSFSRAVVICRTERQAFGNFYRCELFRYMEVFYVSSLCRPITFNNIKELLLLGGAKLTENRYKAKFIVGDKRRADDDRIYLSPIWVLDSITSMQVQKFGKYLMKCAIVTPHGIRYEDPCREHGEKPRRNLKVCYKDPALLINK
ncbi:GH20404 [Drosophila grimshawi]|uniref:GH20404 n=3 Tax=Drosophila grimshawi TaxID=7222 RepID=B4J9V6_DROGR|nr:GH20404 [Drosophila grimshawi]